MIRTLLSLALALALTACAAPGPVQYTHTAGKVTVTEYDDHNNVVKSYFVEGTDLRRDLGAGTLIVPGADHPLKNYSVDR